MASVSAIVADIRQLLRHPALAVWCIYVALIPFYLFKSGLPQPGDMVVLVLLPIVLGQWNGRLEKGYIRVLRPLIWFTAWVCLVDFGWAVILGNFGLFGMDTFVLFPLYYIYNLLIFLAALILYRRFGDAFLRLTLYVVFATLFLQVAASFVIRSGKFRGSLFFNNPNQLGYYALLAGCLIVLTHRRLKFRLLSSSIALVACAYLALISASRASVLGIVILLVVLLFSNPRIIIAASIAVFALLMVGGPIKSSLESSEERVFRSRNTQVGFFQERGYDRIWQHKEYLVLGAGEGGLSRFAETLIVQNMELHSSAGMILFSYGIVGSILFLWFMLRLVQRSQLRSAVILVPPLIYTVAHQGLRFTMLWVLLAVFVGLKEPLRPKVAQPKLAQPKLAQPKRAT